MNIELASDTDELRELYKELILDHARKPRHFGSLTNVTHSADGINPLCGDKLHLYLQLDDGVVQDAAFEGSGCAISVASASLMTDSIIGKTSTEALQWSDQVTTKLTSGNAEPDLDLGKLVALLGVRQFPSRVKCATLAWRALRAAVEQQPSPASTE